MTGDWESRRFVLIFVAGELGHRQIVGGSSVAQQNAKSKQNSNTSNLPESRIFVQKYRIYQKNQVIHLSVPSERHDEKTEANRRKAGRKVVFLSVRCHRFVLQSSRFVQDFREYTGKAPENPWHKSYFCPYLPASSISHGQRKESSHFVLVIAHSEMRIFVLRQTTEGRTKTTQP